ncbi:MAG: HEAT repeat domain-containing protein, partial [Verrucomicrobiota bacterium]
GHQPRPGRPARPAPARRQPRPAVLKSDAGLREKALACQQLADFAGPAAVPALRRIVTKPGHAAAPEALGALGLIADPAAAQVLGEMLRNGDQALRQAAAHAALVAAERLTAAGQGAEAAKLLETSLTAVPSGPSAEAARRQLAPRRAG